MGTGWCGKDSGAKLSSHTGTVLDNHDLYGLESELSTLQRWTLTIVGDQRQHRRSLSRTQTGHGLDVLGDGRAFSFGQSRQSIDQGSQMRFLLHRVAGAIAGVCRAAAVSMDIRTTCILDEQTVNLQAYAYVGLNPTASMTRIR